VPSDAGYVALLNCTGIRVAGLELGEGQEIRLSLTSDSTVTQNTLSNKNTCIYVERSSKNNVTGNTVDGGGNAFCIHLKDADDNYIFQNSLTNGNQGICLDSSNRNTVIANQITGCFQGIRLFKASGNFILENNVTSNQQGLVLDDTVNWEDVKVENRTVHYPNIHGSTNNTVYGNSFACNSVGVLIYLSSNNTFSSNNFLNNASQVVLENPIADSPMNDGTFFDVINNALINNWDDDVTGNFWGDYTNRYPNAQETNSTGTWDTPYILDENNADHYPLVRLLAAEIQLPKENFPTWWLFVGSVAALFFVVALVGYFVVAKKRKRKP
jgi:parallel beta-helix repeat protein